MIEFVLWSAAFVVLGCVALGFAMVKEIQHYRRLKRRHGENVKRLASKLPMMRNSAGLMVARGVIVHHETEALRRLSVALIGYISRLEGEIKGSAAFVPSEVAELFESCPPILDAIEAIREKEWGEFDEIMKGIPRVRRSKATVKNGP